MAVHPIFQLGAVLHLNDDGAPQRGGDSIGAEWHGFHPLLVVAKKPGQIGSKVVQRQIGDRDPTRKVLQVDHGVLKFLKLGAAV